MVINILIGFVFLCFVVFAIAALYLALGSKPKEKEEKDNSDPPTVGYMIHRNLDE